MEGEGGGGFSEPWVGEEGPEDVGEEVDDELEGEGDGEEELQGVVHRLRLAVALGTVDELQLRLDYVAEEAEEDEHGDAGLDGEAVVEAAALELPFEEDARPGAELEQGGVARRAQDVEPAVARLFVLGVEVVGPTAIVAVLLGTDLDDVQVAGVGCGFQQGGEFGDFVARSIIIAMSGHIVPFPRIKNFVQGDLIT